MKLKILLLAGLLVGVFGLAQSIANASTNPYLQPITKRNIFGLENSRAADHPIRNVLPEVTLHGIVTLPDGPHALVRTMRPAGASAQMERMSLFLRAGAPGKANLHVLDISISAATVTILNHGEVQTLHMRGLRESQPEGKWW